jgi:hypothetical protein
MSSDDFTALRGNIFSFNAILSVRSHLLGILCSDAVNLLKSRRALAAMLSLVHKKTKRQKIELLIN